MTAKLVQLPPHESMTVRECLELSARSHAEFADVIVVAFDQSGTLVVRSSHMSRKDAAWMLLEALDYSRGKDR